MAIPDFQALMLPLLRIAGDGQVHSISGAVTQLGNEFRLSDAEKTEPLKSGGTRLYNRVGWARTYLVKAGLLRKVGTGRFEATERGRDLLANPPPQLNVDYLKAHFPEIAAFHGEDMEEDPPATFNSSNRRWNLRHGIAQRIQRKLTKAMGMKGCVGRSSISWGGLSRQLTRNVMMPGIYVRRGMDFG